ncbi:MULTISPECIES: hypothetical protein [Cycloclasticus]|uniref:Uncharacterized protein n=3 Tax=Cycloclasticus pugetii TaxID=34068 RepID=A0AB33Z0D0_9GAMM|nr:MULTISPECIES: hypothetical protein [Cycloclasticus]EPD12661.1 hypothetical protein L196_08649 [Cycloclasticus pugetii]MDF1829621.1 hypothetical protein [Cycloclasticus pugetii]
MRHFEKMLKNLLTYFILSLIVLQSSAALSYPGQLHLSDVEHVYLDGFLGTSDESAKSIELVDLLEEHERDCCDCCHGHCCVVMFVNSSNAVIQTTRTVISYYSEDAPNGNTKPLIRPPIEHS